MNSLSCSNPLRSQSKTYKILAVYIQIANLPFEKRSRLSSIRLVSLCRSELEKKYGFSASLQHMTDEVKFLSEHGVVVVINGSIVKVHCGVLACVADNIPAHQLGGFVERLQRGHGSGKVGAIHA